MMKTKEVHTMALATSLIASAAAHGVRQGYRIWHKLRGFTPAPH